MPRSPVVTRPATLDDVPALLVLWDELRNVGARAERAINPVATDDVAPRLAEAIADGECHVVLASIDGQPAGMAVFRTIRPDPLSDSRVLQVSHAVVARQHRRRGVGHSLLGAGAAIAEALRVEYVLVEVYPSLRDVSRFYARLGFAPVTMQRVAPVALLRRRLGGDQPVLRVDDLVRRRTRLRRPVPAQRPRRRTTARVD